MGSLLIRLRGAWLLQVATNIVASLLAMEAMNDSEDIKLYINSPGELSPCMLVAYGASWS